MNNKINHTVSNKIYKGAKVVCNENKSKLLNKIYDEDSFEKALSKKNKKLLLQSKNSNFGLLGAPPPLVHVWLYRVAKGDESDIVDLLHSKNILVHDIVRKSHNQAKYLSFKITLPKQHLNEVLSHSFWHLGIHCKVWKECDRIAKTVSFTGKRYRDIKL